MTFLVIAHDDTDPETLSRRQAVRAQHLEGIKAAVESGVVQVGGAILSGAGEMNGSALVVEVESREVLEQLLQNDIYTTSGVWKSFDIYPFKRAF